MTTIGCGFNRSTQHTLQIAEAKMCEEAEFRLKNKERHDTEYFDGQLLEALANARKRAADGPQWGGSGHKRRWVQSSTNSQKRARDKQ